MSEKCPKRSGGLSGKLLAVETEFRFAVYKNLIAKRRGKLSGKGSRFSLVGMKAASTDEGKLNYDAK
jgi:hypothetical protein